MKSGQYAITTDQDRQAVMCIAPFWPKDATTCFPIVHLNNGIGTYYRDVEVIPCTPAQAFERAKEEGFLYDVKVTPERVIPASVEYVYKS
jgi:hypothetical protein